jgi:hypothetical protein
MAPFLLPMRGGACAWPVHRCASSHQREQKVYEQGYDASPVGIVHVGFSLIGN